MGTEIAESSWRFAMRKLCSLSTKDGRWQINIEVDDALGYCTGYEKAHIGIDRRLYLNPALNITRGSAVVGDIQTTADALIVAIIRNEFQVGLETISHLMYSAYSRDAIENRRRANQNSGRRRGQLMSRFSESMKAAADWGSLWLSSA